VRVQQAAWAVLMLALAATAQDGVARTSEDSMTKPKSKPNVNRRGVPTPMGELSY
jgi:hypothetical protein